MGNIFQYLLPPDCVQCNKTTASVTGPSRDYLFKDDHMRLYDSIGLEWPPARGLFGSSLDHLDQRLYEVAIYLDVAIPY